MPDPATLEVRRIVLEHLRGHPARVYLFGSRARGQARTTSDVDVGILSQAPLEPWLLSGLREALEESTVPYRVDVVDLSQVNEDFRQRVLKEGELWSA